MSQKQIEILEKRIQSYKQEIETNKQCVEKWEAELSDLKKQAEPKEGEWWFTEKDGGTTVNDGVLLVSKVEGLITSFKEYYYSTGSCFNSNRPTKSLTRPATTEEITYFMSLHAERSGYAHGKKIQSFEFNGLVTFDENRVAKFKNGNFWYMGNIVRDSNGTWATVVTEKPKNGKLKAKIAELEERIQKAKDILDGK